MSMDLKLQSALNGLIKAYSSLSPYKCLLRFHISLPDNSDLSGLQLKHRGSAPQLGIRLFITNVEAISFRIQITFRQQQSFLFILPTLDTDTDSPFLFHCHFPIPDLRY